MNWVYSQLAELHDLSMHYSNVTNDIAEECKNTISCYERSCILRPSSFQNSLQGWNADYTYNLTSSIDLSIHCFYITEEMLVKSKILCGYERSCILRPSSFHNSLQGWNAGYTYSFTSSIDITIDYFYITRYSVEKW